MSSRGLHKAVVPALVAFLGVLAPTIGAAAQTSPAPDPCASPPTAVGPWTSAYQIATVWEPTPGAPVPRTTAANLGQPTPLDVDADPQPDLVATLSAAPAGGLVLDVARAPGETAILPVSVEAIVTAAAPAARRLRFGYDARTDRAPGAFRVSTQIAADGEQRFVVAQQDRGARIALVSSLVAGGTCTTPVDVRVDFGNSPANASVRAKVGAEVGATLVTSAPGPVTVSTRRVPNGSEERVAVAFDSAPAQVGLTVTPATGTLSFQAAAAVGRIVTTIDTALPGPVGANHIEATLVGVPGSLALSLLPVDSRIVLRSTQPITEVDVRARSENRAFPQLPAGEVGVLFDATGGGLAMAVRAIELRLLNVSLAAGTVTSEMQGGRRFLVDARSDVGRTTPLTFSGIVDTVPSSFRATFEAVPGGLRLAVNGNSPVGFVRLARTGAALLPGTDNAVTEISSIPGQVSLLAIAGGVAVQAADAAGVPAPLGQLRLGASAGAGALPAFVSDAQFAANPSNAAFRDLLETDTTGPSGMVLRLTAVKSLDFTFAEPAMRLQQDGARTRPFAFDVKTPNRQAGLPPTAISGLLNKPSASTVFAADVAPDRPTTLRFENEAPVSSFSLSAIDLGPVPEAHVSLANIPTRLAVCMHAGSQCRPADRLPTALPDYEAFQANPPQGATAGGANRPYPAQVSLSFDDFGTSGSGSTPSSMVTMNATIRMNLTQAPIILTNLRFHSLALDVGLHPTSPTFDFLGSTYPRIYLYLDSGSRPFVMNELKYPPLIESFKVGTDGSPAVADRRLVWLPGTRCTASSFGVCIATGLDARTSGSLDCGGQRAFTVRVSGVAMNLLNLSGQSLPICS